MMSQRLVVYLALVALTLAINAHEVACRKAPATMPMALQPNWTTTLIAPVAISGFPVGWNPLMRGPRYIIADVENNVYGVDHKTGAIAWRVYVPNLVGWYAVPNRQDSLLIQANAFVAVVSFHDGTTKWNTSHNGGFCPPVVFERYLIVSGESQDNFITVALDVDTGARLYKLEVNDVYCTLLPTRYGILVGHVYIIAQNMTTMAGIDARTGSITWSVQDPPTLPVGFQGVNSARFVTFINGTWFMNDLLTGRNVWQFQCSACYVAATTEDLFVLGSVAASTTMALSVATGIIIWTNLQLPVVSGAIPALGRFLAAVESFQSGQCTAVSFDSSSGMIQFRTVLPRCGQQHINTDEPPVLLTADVAVFPSINDAYIIDVMSGDVLFSIEGYVGMDKTIAVGPRDAPTASIVFASIDSVHGFIGVA